jgi:hypothetical protein
MFELSWLDEVTHFAHIRNGGFALVQLEQEPENQAVSEVRANPQDVRERSGHLQDACGDAVWELCVRRLLQSPLGPEEK